MNANLARIDLLVKMNIKGVQSIDDLANTPNNVPKSGGISWVPSKAAYMLTRAYGDQETKNIPIKPNKHDKYKASYLHSSKLFFFFSKRSST